MTTPTSLYRRHGLRDTPEWKAWSNMKQRCSNAQNARYYRERGIVVCPEWRDSFEAFLRDMGPRPSPAHSIDRRDNDGNYEASNCRWATKREQQHNKRKQASASQYRGVKRSGERWQAYQKRDGRNHHLGSFTSEVDAARARDTFVREHAIPTPLNFQEET